jgi:hypothetical protein
MVEIGATVLRDANHVTAPAALRDIDEKTVAGFLWKKAESDDFPD